MSTKSTPKNSASRSTRLNMHSSVGSRATVLLRMHDRSTSNGAASRSRYNTLSLSCDQSPENLALK